MLMGIFIEENEYRRLSDEQKLDLLDDAFFRARLTKIRAQNYAERVKILNLPEEEVLDKRQSGLVNLLKEGYLD